MTVHMENACIYNTKEGYTVYVVDITENILLPGFSYEERQG